MITELAGEFLVDSTYSELPLLTSKLAVIATSLSGLAVNMGDAF